MSREVIGCLACDTAAGRVPLPGGRIGEHDGWLIEPCIGPLPAGTLIRSRGGMCCRWPT